MEKRYDLTFPQENIWLVNKLYNSSKTNLITGIININKGFNEINCAKAVNLVIKNNDALRIKIKVENNNPYQIIEEYVYQDIKIIDMQSFDDLKKEEYISEYKKRDIDILNDKLFEFVVLKYSNDSGAVLLKMHHIVSDAWSYSKIVEQFIKYYNNIENGEDAEEDTIPGYTEYINSTMEYKNSEKYAKDATFWNEYLEGYNEEVSLKSKTKNISNTCKRYNVKLDKKENDDIKEYCKMHRTSPYVLFLAALSTYIYRIKDRNDIVVGTPTLNRANFKEKQMLGMFVATLPLRIKLNESETFLNLVQEIGRNTMGIFRHQKFPYTEIVKNVHDKNNNISKLFSILLSYQNARVEYEDIEKYDTKWYANDFQNEDLQIHMLDMDSTGILEINYDYLDEIFEDVEIEYLHTRLLSIIKHAIEDESIDIENINIMSEEEKNVILNDFNNTKMDYPKDKSIIDLFEEQVEKTPQSIALVFEDRKVTYNNLNEMTNCMANYLTEKGINKGNKVALLLKRSEKLIVSILAILKCGATYIPLDISYPQKRIEYILNDSNPEFVITEEGLQFENKLVLNDETFIHIISNYGKESITNIYNPDSSAYIIYTSGSTGNPKGVVISNNNLLNFVLGINNELNLNENDSLASITTVSFDIFGLEMFVTLLNGCKLVLANNTQCVNGNELNLLCVNNSVNVIQTTPTKLKLLLEQNNNLFIKQMQKIILGGENITTKFIEELNNITDADIYDAYGPTETTIWSTISKLKNANKIVAGKPISNTNIFILDKKQRLLPVGVEGELAISGDGLATGYYNNISSTNSHFVYNKVLRKRIYLTGDFCKINFDGNLEVLDRIDLQVKVNGQRVELQEIEKNINQFNNINNSIVILKDNKLVCFYDLIDKKNKVKSNDVISYLYDKLPLYMIPKEYYYLQEIPLTLNGKLDRKQVNSIEIEDKKSVEHIKPITKIQKDIYEIWKKVITNREFGVNDPFFELGTDSLDAIKVQIDLLSLGIHIDYADLFKYPTIIDLEKLILNEHLKSKKYVHDEIINYNEFNDILLNNKDTNYIPKENKIKNIILTGATGYLGAHILDEFMKNYEDGKIYCIVRSKKGIDSKTRLKNRLKYYFSDKYDEEIGNRINVLDADITDIDSLNKEFKKAVSDDIDLLIHSAACVKHYGDAGYFKKINVDGTEAIAKLCFAHNIKLIHISTISVSGNSFETLNLNKNTEHTIFDESCFYKNQNLNNIYVYTKFKSEQIVLEYIKKGLEANIVRIGNLTNRFYDLKFQFNEKENAFENRIKTILNIKVFPERNIDMYLEFTPVDLAANAIINIMKYFNIKHNVYHIYNNNHVTIKEFINVLEELGIKITILNDNDFSDIIREISNSDGRDVLSGIINDLNKDNVLDYNTNVEIKNDYTNNFLEKIGFIWPKITKEYLINYIKKLNKKEE